MKIFLDTEKAAALMGVSKRTFERKYVDTKRVRVIRFGASRSAIPKGDRKHLFLREELEKLKRGTAK